MDTEQITRYFTRLYGQGATFELVAIKGQSVTRKDFIWGSTQEAAAIKAIQKAEEAGYNVYASAMPLEVQEEGLYDRVWVDQDDVDGPWPWGTDPDLQWPKPTTLVKTSEEAGGFRWQAIWLLDDALPEERARNMMRRMAKQIGADGSVHDPRRILRVPGVTNAKRGVPARLMDTAEGLISPSAFSLPKETTVTKLLSADINNPNAILGEFLAGVGEGERNHKAYVCARFLRSTGVVHDDALAIVALGASRCSPAMPEHEVRNAVRSAYHGAR